jgi:hypothetical protein
VVRIDYQILVFVVFLDMLKLRPLDWILDLILALG